MDRQTDARGRGEGTIWNNMSPNPKGGRHNSWADNPAIFFLSLIAIHLMIVSVVP